MSTRWRSLVTQFSFPKSRSQKAQVELTKAYREVFTGRPDKAQQELVLADLMAKSGWNRVSPPTMSSEQLWHREGKRTFFAVIFGHLSLADEDVRALENAARLEVVADEHSDFND